MEDKAAAAASSSLPAIAPTEFTTDSSSWALGPDDSDGTYFFSGDRETSSIISDFGWNLEPEQPYRIGVDDKSDVAGGESMHGGGGGLWFPDHSAAPGGSMERADKANEAADASTSNNQSASSTSSEDPPDKSTVSDEKPPEIQ